MSINLTGVVCNNQHFKGVRYNSKIVKFTLIVNLR